MTMKKMCIALITLSAMLVFAHDPEPVYQHRGREHEGSAGQVFRNRRRLRRHHPPGGQRPPDAVALTVEENNLQLQNVSDRTIRKMIVLAQTTDVRGNHLLHVRHFLDNNKT